MRQSQPAPVTLSSWPFVTGVPLPQGKIADVLHVRLLDSRGQAVPAQFEPLTHWSSKHESIKWLRLTFDAPCAEGQAPQYQLQFGSGMKPAAVNSPIRVVKGDADIAIDTGAITLKISRKQGGILTEVLRNAKGPSSASAAAIEVYKAQPGDGPYVTDHTDAIFRAALDTVPTITVEESGPVRAVVRVEAWHKRDPRGDSKPPVPPGDRLKSVLRYYAYAGQPWVQLDWTFIIAADTDLVRFKDIGLRMTGSGSARIGLDGGQEVALTDGYLLQKKADLYVVRQKQGESYVETSRGIQSPGLNANDSFSLTMRDFWPMFPKELEAKSEIPSRSTEAGAGGRNLKSEIILHAWPGHGEFNADWFAEPTRRPGADAVPPEIVGATGVKLTPAYLQWLQRWHHGALLDFHYPDWWRQPNIAGTPQQECWLDKLYPRGNHHWESFGLWSAAVIRGGSIKEHAMGASRTQQILLDFSGDQSAVLAARRAMFTAAPHVWLENPQWLAETRALGPMNVRSAEPYDKADLEAWEHLDQIKYYGMWVYGNMPEYFEKDGAPAIYRQLNGSPHYGFFNTGWLLYLTTGHADHLKYALANTRHWRDVAIVHHTTEEFEEHPDGYSRKYLGAAHAVGFYPWRMGVEFDFYAGVFPMLLDYYLTGDRRSLDVAQLHAENLMIRRKGEGFSREVAGNHKTMLDWYAHSWDPAVAEWIDAGILSIVSNDPDAEKSKGPTPLNWTNFMPQYLELAALDPGLSHREKLVAYIEQWCKEYVDTDRFRTGYMAEPGNMLAAAWFATGNVKYLHPFMRAMVRDDVPPDQWLVPSAPEKGAGTGGAVRFDEVLYSYAAWRDAVEKKLMPKSEGDLPLPDLPGKYRCPIAGTYSGGGKSPQFFFLKEPDKEIQLAVGSSEPGIKITFYAPDGGKALEKTTEKGSFAPMAITIPASAKAGVYRLELVGEMFNFWCEISTRAKHVLKIPEGACVGGGSEWVFMVPNHVERFTVKFTGRLTDPSWKTAALGKSADEMQTIEVKPEHRGRLWRYRFDGHGGAIGAIKLDGIPPCIAAHPDWWFPLPSQ